MNTPSFAQTATPLAQSNVAPPNPRTGPVDLETSSGTTGAPAAPPNPRTGPVDLDPGNTEGAEVPRGTDGQATTEATAQDAAPTGSPLSRAQAVAKRAKAAALRDAQMKAERSRLAEQNNRSQAEVQALRAQAQQATQTLEAIKRDPLAVLKQLGIKNDELYRRAAQEGTPEARIEALAAQLEAERKARIALETQTATEKEQVQYKRIEQDFVTRSKDAALYPALASTPSAILLAAGTKLAIDARKRTGHDYSNSEILSGLNKIYAAHQASTGATRKEVPQASDSPSTGSQARANPSPSRTISNALASRSFTQPSNFDDLTGPERTKALVDMVKRMRAPK
jgi:hypothetical protein